MYFLAIDPGRAQLGWSAWRCGELVDCGLARTQYTQLGAIAQHFASQMPKGANRVLVERMWMYPPKPGESLSRATAVANDLLDLQAIGGMVAALCLAPGCFIEWQTAAQWKGQVPKDVTHRRLKKSLSVVEYAVMENRLAAVPKSLQHNVKDAVALGVSVCRSGERGMQYGT